MTQPAGQPTAEQVDAQADEKLAYERAAEGSVVAALAVDIGVALATIYAAWETLERVGHTAHRVNDLITVLAAQKLAGIDPDMRPALNREIRKGMALGARHAYELRSTPATRRAAVNHGHRALARRGARGRARRPPAG